MKAMTRWMQCCAFAVILGLTWTGSAVAQIPEVSYLPIDQPTEIGGTILEPGVYVIRVVPNFNNRAFVQVMDYHQENVLATVLSVPHALSPTERLQDTKFVFLPATGQHPRALKSWFAPGSSSEGGHDFVYDERAVLPRTLVAEMEYVDPVDEDLRMSELEPATPPTRVTIVAESEPAYDSGAAAFEDTTDEATRAAQVARDQHPQMTTDALELPRTAGRAPALVIAGLLLLGAATGIRSMRSS